jgi:hypothetical protein
MTNCSYCGRTKEQRCLTNTLTCPLHQECAEANDEIDRLKAEVSFLRALVEKQSPLAAFVNLPDGQRETIGEPIARAAFEKQEGKYK